MYKFTAERALYKSMKGKKPQDCLPSYIEALKKKGIFIGAFSAFMKMWESWIFYSPKVKQHRYINSKKLIDQFISASVTMENITDIETRFMHFESGCFVVGGVEVTGCMFMSCNGEIHTTASVIENGKVEYLMYSLSDTDFNKDLGFVGEYEASDTKDVDSDTEVCRAVGKVCFVASLYEGIGKCSVKDGLWRKRFKHNGIANVIQYPEPKRTVAWHFRQLRHERYYRGDYKNLERGSRWIFVCPDEQENSMKTVLK